jgi:hypothetical protein
MEMYTSEDEELMINGQRFTDFLSTIELKIMDLEYQVGNQQVRIDSLESDNVMIEGKLNEQVVINNNFRDFIIYIIDAEMFYTMSYNFAKKLCYDNKVTGDHLISNASMVASTISNTVNYGDEAYSLDYWSLIFEKAIEMGVSKDILYNRLVEYSKNVTRYSAHTINGYDLNSQRPKLSSFIQRKFNYYDILTLFTSNCSDKNCLAKIVIQSLCPYYKVEYINYLFKQWTPNMIVQHWQYIRSVDCSSLRDSYFNNMYKILSSKSGEHYEAFKDDKRFIESLRNASSRIDNYYKLRNQ